MITLETTAGQHISATCKEAVDLAKSSGENVKFIFNGVTLVCTPNTYAKDLEKTFNIKLEENCKAYLASPEGIAQKREADFRLKESQAQTDSLMIQLPVVINKSQEALITWLAKLSDCGDHVSVTFNKDRVIKIIEDSGYRRNAFTGLSPESYLQKNIFGSYIIGQALDCLYRGMPPHPIIQKFAKDFNKLK